MRHHCQCPCPSRRPVVSLRYDSPSCCDKQTNCTTPTLCGCTAVVPTIAFSSTKISSRTSLLSSKPFLSVFSSLDPLRTARLSPSRRTVRCSQTCFFAGGASLDQLCQSLTRISSLTIFQCCYAWNLAFGRLLEVEQSDFSQGAAPRPRLAKSIFAKASTCFKQRRRRRERPA